MDAWFPVSADMASLLAGVREAEAREPGAVVVSEGPLGDPLVLAGALSQLVSRALVGVRLTLGPSGRHPTVLARDMTTLDLLCGGRSLLCVAPPFPPGLPEALALCRAMWRSGLGRSDGPDYPVPGARNRPWPGPDGGPVLAIDLTGGGLAPPGLEGLVDLVARPGSAGGAQVLEPA